MSCLGFQGQEQLIQITGWQSSFKYKAYLPRVVFDFILDMFLESTKCKQTTAKQRWQTELNPHLNPQTL